MAILEGMTYGLHSQDPQYRERRRRSSWECQSHRLHQPDV